MKVYLVPILFFGLIQAKTESPSILILNEYDSKVVDGSISNYFPSKNFINSEDTSPFLGSLDSLVNPASGRMS